MLDEEATKNKEISLQAELYRILKNYANEGLSIAESFTHTWAPDDILIEASIKMKDGITKEADLVLLARGTQYSREVRKPVLVIETKERSLTYRTQHYQKTLSQAREYAHTIGCKMYAVYDGYTLIVMHIAHPYLIGLTTWTQTKNDRKNREFARTLWNRVIESHSGISPDYLSGFTYHPDFEPWKKSIYSFIRDAYLFKIEVDQEMSRELFNIEEDSELLASKWRSLYD